MTLPASFYDHVASEELWEPCNNDLPSTEPEPGEYRDHWTGNEPWRDVDPQQLYDDPLLAVLLGAPRETYTTDPRSKK